jgi:hypothetical protein
MEVKTTVPKSVRESNPELGTKFSLGIIAVWEVLNIKQALQRQ